MAIPTRLRIIVLVWIMTGLACRTVTPTAPQPAPTGRIVYQSDQNGNSELYWVDFRGSWPVRITNNTANDLSPAYIVATDQIGFVSDGDKGWNLYTMDLRSGSVFTVTKLEKAWMNFPSWSTNGISITVSMIENCPNNAPDCKADIYVMNADGAGLKPLANDKAAEWDPVWSPDGNKIAYASDQDGDAEIYLIDVRTMEVTQLTNNSNYDGHPRWSPDGTRLAFDTDREGGDWDIYIMNADGSDPQAVTHNRTNDFSPAWSPDGNWLVYVSDSEGDQEIYVIDIHGKNQRRLTTNTISDTYPVWIP